MGVDDGRDADPRHDGWDPRHDDADGTWRLADDDMSWADAELDGRVRQRLATLVPLRHEAFDRWDELQPRMTRARRRRHATQALATSLLVAAVALAGVQAAGRFLPEDSSMVSAASGGDGTAASDSRPPMIDVGQATSTIADDGSTASATAGTALTPDEQPAGGAAPDGGPVASETSLPPASVPGSADGSSSAPVNGGSAASSVSLPPPTTFSPTTAIPASTSTSRATTTTTRRATTTVSTTSVAVRDLSTIDVTVRGSEIRLVAVHDNPGVTSQVHNSGPEKIEISFTKGHDEHELVATVRNGNVVTSVVDAEHDD